MHWAEAHLLCLSPLKSEAMIFSRKQTNKYNKILESAPKLVVAGKPISFEPETVRYLGIWLDRNLSWRHHLRIKCQKVRNLLSKVQGASGRLWGLKPFLGKYFWEAMGRTVLGFGCIGWIPCIRTKANRRRLCSLQRSGLKLVTFFRKGTPNRGLELLYNVPPLEVWLIKTAIKAYFRTSGLEPHSRESMYTATAAHMGHRSFIHDLITHQGLNYLGNPLDSIPPFRVWERAYQVALSETESESLELVSPAFSVTGYRVFTDGSKEDDRTGAGIILYEPGFPVTAEGPALTYSTKLLGDNSVFQTEVWAIKKASQLLLEGLKPGPSHSPAWVKEDEEVTIFSDSQAALKALRAVHIKSQLVWETVEKLNELGAKVPRLNLCWVKGHSKFTGNVRADKEARKGRDEHVSANPDSPRLPKAKLHIAVEAIQNELWKKVFRLEPGCTQTRNWFPHGPRPDFAFDIIRLPRLLCSQMTQFVTGHCFLNRHQALIDNSDRAHVIASLPENEKVEGELIIPISSALCRRCGTAEEKPEHLMSDCVDLAAIRLRIFAHPFPRPPYTNFKVFQIVAFLKEVKLQSLEMRPFLEEYIPANIPEEARPTPPLPIVEGAELVSSSDEDEAARRAAETAGGLMLHNYLLTMNAPPLQDPKGARFY